MSGPQNPTAAVDSGDYNVSDLEDGSPCLSDASCQSGECTAKQQDAEQDDGPTCVTTFACTSTSSGSSGLSTGVIVAIVVIVLLCLACIGIAIYCVIRNKGSKDGDGDGAEGGKEIVLWDADGGDGDGGVGSGSSGEQESSRFGDDKQNNEGTGKKTGRGDDFLPPAAEMPRGTKKNTKKNVKVKARDEKLLAFIPMQGNQLIYPKTNTSVGVGPNDPGFISECFRDVHYHPPLKSSWTLYAFSHPHFSKRTCGTIEAIFCGTMLTSLLQTRRVVLCLFLCVALHSDGAGTLPVGICGDGATQKRAQVRRETEERRR